MDTPKDMMDFFQDAYKGGNYWGGGDAIRRLTAFLRVERKVFRRPD